MDRKTVLRKILGLKNLGEHPKSPKTEAEVALRLAQQLIFRYAVRAEEISKLRQTTKFTKQGKPFDRRGPEDVKVIAILERFFSVQIVRDNSVKELIFIGEEPAIEIAQAIFDFLKQTYKDCWHEYYYSFPTSLRRRTDKPSFYEGLTIGLRKKLQAQRSQTEAEQPEIQTALALQHRSLAKAVREMYPHLTHTYRRSPRNLNAQLCGEVRGKKITISPFLKTGIQSKQLN